MQDKITIWLLYMGVLMRGKGVKWLLKTAITETQIFAYIVKIITNPETNITRMTNWVIKK